MDAFIDVFFLYPRRTDESFDQLLTGFLSFSSRFTIFLIQEEVEEEEAEVVEEEEAEEEEEQEVESRRGPKKRPPRFPVMMTTTYVLGLLVVFTVCSLRQSE